MAKRLLCAKVEPLYAFSSSYREFWIKQPTICSLHISDRFINDIHDVLEVIRVNKFAEATIAIDYVTWHYSVNETVIQKINSSLHVEPKEIYFTGSIHPEKKASFKSSVVNIADILNTPIHPLEINSQQIDTVEAKFLIKEIESLNNEYQTIYQRRDALEDIKTSLERLPPQPLSINDINDQIPPLSQHIVATEHALEKIEKKLVTKCLDLCKSVLGIEKGDSVWFQDDKMGRQSLVLNDVRFWDGTMFLDGSNILKSGARGKRKETISLQLYNPNERQ